MKQIEQMTFLPDLDLDIDAEFTQLFQEIDYDLLMYELKKVLGHEPNDATRELFRGVRWLPNIFERLTGPDILEDIAFYKNTTGKGRLGEFYIAMLTGAKWDPKKNIPGYDLLDVYKSGNQAGIARIQVKTSGPLTEFNDDSQWIFRIVNDQGQMLYDVLICIGLRDDYNPCNASLFVIPAADLVEIAKKGSRFIGINSNRYWGGTRYNSSIKNQWYEYELPLGSHNLLISEIAKIAISNNLVILSSHLE